MAALTALHPAKCVPLRSVRGAKDATVSRFEASSGGQRISRLRLRVVSEDGEEEKQRPKRKPGLRGPGMSSAPLYMETDEQRKARKQFKKGGADDPPGGGGGDGGGGDEGGWESGGNDGDINPFGILIIAAGVIGFYFYNQDQERKREEQAKRSQEERQRKRLEFQRVRAQQRREQLESANRPYTYAYEESQESKS